MHRGLPEEWGVEMEKHHIFVYEPTHKDAISTANDIYKYLANKTRITYQVGTFIYSDIITVRVGSSVKDANDCLYYEVFDVPDKLKSKFDACKIDGGLLAPFAGTVYDYIDCLVSHVSNTGKGLPPGYFEAIDTILKGGEKQ